MKLDLQYLNRRHAYWMYRIGEKEIWNPAFFSPISIVIRPASKRYNGLFIRKYLKIKGKRQLTDRIFIYDKTEDLDPKFLDSILVHEMIHQYICQAKLKDTSSHGSLFRDFMHKINLAFPDELQIKISDRNPNINSCGEGEKNHLLLIIHFDNNMSFCCVINPSRAQYFEEMIKSDKFKWKIKSHFWAVSKDLYFNNFSKCTRSLHGIKQPYDELLKFCRERNVRLLNA